MLKHFTAFLFIIASFIIPSYSFALPQFCSGKLLLDQRVDLAGVVFTADTNCPNCVNITGSTQQTVADNFVLTKEETITEFTLSVIYTSGNIPLTSDIWTVIIHNDAAGLPGTAIATETNVPTQRVNTGQIFANGNFDIYRSILTLKTPVTLPVGTYWVEFYNNSSAETNRTANVIQGILDPINGIANGSFATATPGVNWLNPANFNAPNSDGALQICSKEAVGAKIVPTVGKYNLFILMLLISSLVGFLFYRRKFDLF